MHMHTYAHAHICTYTHIHTWFVVLCLLAAPLSRWPLKGLRLEQSSSLRYLCSWMFFCSVGHSISSIVLVLYYIVLYCIHCIYVYYIVYIILYCIVLVLYSIVLYQYCIVLVLYSIVLYQYCIVLYCISIVLLYSISPIASDTHMHIHTKINITQQIPQCNSLINFGNTSTQVQSLRVKSGARQND